MCRTRSCIINANLLIFMRGILASGPEVGLELNDLLIAVMRVQLQCVLVLLYRTYETGVIWQAVCDMNIVFCCA